jgi:DNA-binding NarL/FixJ family response regulator
MIGLLCFFLTLFASPFKSKSRLEAENAALRHQLIVLQRKVCGRIQLTLDRLNRLAIPPKDPVTVHTSDAAEQPWIDADENYEMLMYVAGGASNADRDKLERIKALRALASDVPLMILSNSETREKVISTLNVGARGLLYVGANAELALQAVSFMLNGGSYLPSAGMRPEQTYPSQRHPATDCIPIPSCVMGGGNGAAKDLEDEDPKNHSLTARQGAVVELLLRGDSNKAIGRLLGMREGTVKVHVRHIMRKLGVTNRTQVAVVCANGRQRQKAATPAEVESPGRKGATQGSGVSPCTNFSSTEHRSR